MTERWYYKTRTGVVGPLSIEELAASLQAGVLAPNTLVRRGIGGQWRGAAEALSNLAGMAVANKTAGQILAEADMAAFRQAAAGGVESRFSATAMTVRALVRLQELLDVFASPAQAAAGSIGRRIGRKTVLVVVFMVAAVILIHSLPTFDPSLTDIHSEVSAVLIEAQSLSDHPAGQAEWDAFAGPALARLESLAAKLDKADDRQRRWALLFGEDENVRWVRRELIQLTKQDLPAALRSGPNGVSQYKPIIGRRMTRIARAASYQRGTPPHRQSSPATRPKRWTIDVVTITLLVTPMVLFGSAALFWWRRRIAI